MFWGHESELRLMFLIFPTLDTGNADKKETPNATIARTVTQIEHIQVIFRLQRVIRHYLNSAGNKSLLDG